MAGAAPPDCDRAEKVDMGTRAILVAVLLALSLPCLAKDESVPELKARADAAKPEDRPKLCVEVAQRQLKTADKLFEDGNTNEAIAAVNDVVNYSERAADAAVQTGKKLKHTEIAVRKMAERLRDMKRTLSFEDQPAVQDAAEHMEKLR